MKNTPKKGVIINPVKKLTFNFLSLRFLPLLSIYAAPFNSIVQRDSFAHPFADLCVNTDIYKEIPSNYLAIKLNIFVSLKINEKKIYFNLSVKSSKQKQSPISFSFERMRSTKPLFSEQLERDGDLRPVCLFLIIGRGRDGVVQTPLARERNAISRLC